MGGHTLQINFSYPAGTYNNYFPHYRFRCTYKVHELYLAAAKNNYLFLLWSLYYSQTTALPAPFHYITKAEAMIYAFAL